MSSNILIRAQWARRLVREKIAAQLNDIQRRDQQRREQQPGHRFSDVISMPIGDGQAHIDPLKLPRTKSPSQPARAQIVHKDAAELRELRVSITGAGMAGLYIAMILDDLQVPGLKYDLLEASDRVGGRVFTHYFSETTHDYYDIGAMRFPQVCSVVITTCLSLNILDSADGPNIQTI